MIIGGYPTNIYIYTRDDHNPPWESLLTKQCQELTCWRSHPSEADLQDSMFLIPKYWIWLYDVKNLKQIPGMKWGNGFGRQQLDSTNNHGNTVGKTGECQLKMIRFEGTINPSVVFWLLSRLGSDGTARAPWISASCQ
jgi:hypothetical protein